jgi:valyl-tRNA synthetase
MTDKPDAINLPSRYSFSSIEDKIRTFWKQKSILKTISEWNPELSKAENFVIDTPPPTISGHLHMGHVLSYCHTDFIARFKRMTGKNVFYPMGFDDNGLPTERLVEKVKGVKAKDLPRVEFAKLCKDLINEEIPKFRALFEELALSVDWSLSYSTASLESCRLSQMSFLDLVQKGAIYQEEQAVFWDPVDGTTTSHSEIEEKEQFSLIYDIAFDLVEGSDRINIATTRPELLAACVAIFYNPLDARYQNLESKFAITPLFDVKVPILPDVEVIPSKGTGLVMCCTFGDMLDVAWWKKYNLPLRQILNSNGSVGEMDFTSISFNAQKAQENFSKLTGLYVKDARKEIVKLLQEDERLINQNKVQNIVKCAERSGAPLEIRVTKQWFIKTLIHKEMLLSQASKISWHPEGMKARLESWIHGLSSDWCISRQRFFGVAIPVWYLKSTGKPIFPRVQDLPVDPFIDLPIGRTREEVTADLDVMDTWATSCISPQINALGISAALALNPDRYAKLFPADIRPQGHEIIRTWAFGTILKSYLHSESIPWQSIMVSGWCLAEDKQKMSKSRGNIVTPANILSEYGSDVIRYWSASAKLGGNTVLSQDVLEEGKKLITKLWNASRFSLMHTASLPTEISLKNTLQSHVCCVSDAWILCKLDETITEISQNFEKFQYHVAKQNIVAYFKREFCDRYIELVKSRVSSPNHEWRSSAQVTLNFCMNTILKLFAPFFPYVTEELFAYFDKSGESIHAKGRWPSLTGELIKVINPVPAMEIALSVLDLVNKLKHSLPGRILGDLYIYPISVSIPPDLIADLKGSIFAREIFVCSSEKELPENFIVSRGQFCVLAAEFLS